MNPDAPLRLSASASPDAAPASPVKRARRSPLHNLSRYLRPRASLSPREGWIISGVGVSMFFALWIAVTSDGFIQPFFLPSPAAVATRLVSMLYADGFLIDIWASAYRILGGFLIAAALAVPLGVLMGNFRFFQALFEPLFGAARYMPASAFIPLLIIWLGIDEGQKISVVFLGVFFPLTLMIADASSTLSQDIVHSAYTLGASSMQVFFRVLIPASTPAIVDALRITVGIAWTYVIVAELVGAQRGMGIAILQAQRFLLTDQVIAGIISVGVLGVITDVAFRIAHRKLFPYMY